jgi:FkbM family methyltransferase
MKKLLHKIINLTKSKEIREWRKIEGDKNLRLNYDLNENSIVFDVGGYEGQWASDIYAKYNCTIHVFEPITEYAENIKNRFAKNPKIIVHKFGLSDKSEDSLISLNADGSSVHGNGKKQAPIKLKSVADFWQEAQIGEVALMKINIEGGEYLLLENLISAGLVKHVHNLQIQFHKISNEAIKLRDNLQVELNKTHKQAWDYPFVWESWSINN